jgi:hypothetical protein
MLYLTELSVPALDVRSAALSTDPLVAADPGYAVKTWLSLHPDLAIRPWTAIPDGSTLRLLGWRSTPPAPTRGAIYVGWREVSLEADETLALTGTVIPLRRCKHVARDAAADRDDPIMAYTSWLRERLVETTSLMTVQSLAIRAHARRRVLRKAVRRGGGNKVVKAEVVPTATVDITITVKDPPAVESWLLQGLGPQKAFGFGCFLPC